MNRNKNPAWKLFMKTGLPEAYTAYSMMNESFEGKEDKINKRRAK